MDIQYRESKSIPREAFLPLYQAVGWSSAEKPNELERSIAQSHHVVSVWDGEKLVGLVTTLSDGALVVYYSHVLVHPAYQGKGLGRELMTRAMRPYRDFHQQTLLADGDAVNFFASLGFQPAGNTRSMWIYQGHDH